MHLRAAVALALGLAIAPIPVQAQEAETLRRELEELKRQLQITQQQYQQTIEALTQRLQRLEAQSPMAPPGPAAAAPTVPAAPSTRVATPSFVDLARPREPFALYERRGAGQLLFDMGVTGDFAGSLTSKRVEQAHAGSLTGEENRVFPREIELSLFGQIDPYARAEVRFEAGEELEADRTRSLSLSLAEANLTLMTLPFGTQLKVGRERLRFGYLNEFHQHDRPFIDNPDVLVQFFGDEGLVENGAEFSWVAPLPVYLQAIVGVFDGDNDQAFGKGSLREPLLTARLRTFLELGETSALQFGVSGAYGGTAANTRASYLGFDAKYKYMPEGWQHPLLTVGGELFLAHRKLPVVSDTTTVTSGEAATDEPVTVTGFQKQTPYGYYVWADLQPWRRWVFGLRYDWTEFPDGPGHAWAIGPYISFMPSEFLRFRLGFKHTERSGVGDPRTIDELLFQATFILGAHPADLF
jgi:hypothetical protein